jgi:hypothetical protein
VFYDNNKKPFDSNDAAYIVAQANSGAIPVVQGGPGQAKTVSIEMFSDELSRRTGIDYAFHPVNLSTQQPEDAGGTPTFGEIKIDGVNHRCIVPLMQEAQVRALNSPTVVFLDEINQCSEAVMAANQELWFNRPPGDCIVIGAMNPPDIATDGIEFPPAVVNRICLLDWTFDHDGWLDGMAKGSFSPPNFPIVSGDWSGFAQKWCGLVSQFARQNPQHFDWNAVFPKSDDYGKPWRSPRSWERSATCLGAAESVGASRDTAIKILTGFVGLGPTSEFFTWVDSIGLPSSEELFYFPGRLNLPPSFDLAVSVVGGVHSYCKQQMEVTTDTAQTDHFERGLDFCEAAFLQSRELGSAIAGRFVKLKPAHYQPKQRQHPLWDAINLTRQPAVS